MATLRVSVEAVGERTEEASRLVKEFVDLIEGADAYIRPPENFITVMVPSPCTEPEDKPPHFSIFLSIVELPEVLLLSFVALRLQTGCPSVTACVVHEVMVLEKEDLREVCEQVVRCLADNDGGIRWAHKFEQLCRDAARYGRELKTKGPPGIHDDQG